MEKITNKESTQITIDYDRIFRKFVATYELYTFEFSLRVFEICHNLFPDYPEILKSNFIAEKEYKYNSFLFAKLTTLLKIPNNIEVVNYIYALYTHCLIICNEISKRCFLCTYSSLNYTSLSEKDRKALAIEEKYKFRQRIEITSKKGKFEHYWYEFEPAFTEDRTAILKFIDSVRKNLVEHGDTLESINSRDSIISVLKHFEYLDKGVKVEQSIPIK